MPPSHRCKQRLSGNGPKLEVADIFRAHGPAYRREHSGHLNLQQLKVMSSIETCRTAALLWLPPTMQEVSDLAGV